MKTQAMDIEMASARAPITGATAAIALPPQMAVPTEIRLPQCLSSEKILARNRPATRIVSTPMPVTHKPVTPPDTTVASGSPKPSPTTQIFSSSPDIRPTWAANGFPSSKANAIPAASAMGALMPGQRQAAHAIANRIDLNRGKPGNRAVESVDEYRRKARARHGRVPFANAPLVVLQPDK